MIFRRRRREEGEKLLFNSNDLYRVMKLKCSAIALNYEAATAAQYGLVNKLNETLPVRVKIRV